jgi:hypothetical protein
MGTDLERGKENVKIETGHKNLRETSTDAAEQFTILFFLWTSE